MDRTNLLFSSEEQALLMNKEIILTKNQVLRKLQCMMDNLISVYEKMLQGVPGLSESEAFQRSPKTAKGESYNEFPWMMLDYPRSFGIPDTFAIRSFFGWGTGFNISVHLAGKYQRQYGTGIEDYFKKHDGSQWLVCVADNAWHHIPDSIHYRSVTAMQAGWASALPFLRIMYSLEADRFEAIPNLFTVQYQTIIAMLTADTKLPSGETIL